MIQETCIWTGPSGGTHYADVYIKPDNNSGDNFVKAHLRVELHDCRTGRGLSALGYGTYENDGALNEYTGEVRKDSFRGCTRSHA